MPPPRDDNAVRAGFDWLAAKAATPAFTPYGGGYGSGWWGGAGNWIHPPGAKYDYGQEAGDLWRNSAVAACLRWIGDNFAEPGRRVVRRDGSGEWVPEPGHPLLALLERPNPHYGWHTLAKSLALSYRTDGNAFWMIGKGLAGDPVQLWWLPHYAMRPRWDNSGYQYLGWWDYFVGGRVIPLKTSDVVHFRDGIDPLSDRLGCAPLKHAVREVCSDNEGAGFTASVLRNSGVLSYFIQPMSPDVSIDDDDRREIKKEFQENSTRENRGQVMVASAQVRLDKLGSTPEELTLDKILRMPEARICAALGVPPQVVGLTSGDSSKTFNNYETARKAAYLDGIVPFQKEVAWTINQRLMPLFEKDPASVRFEFDYSRVEALAESESDKVERWGKAFFNFRVAKLNESRAAIGLPPEDGPAGDEYYGGATAVGTPPAPPKPGTKPPKPDEDDEIEDDGDGDPEAKSLTPALHLLYDAAAPLGLSGPLKAGTITADRRRDLCHAVSLVVGRRLRHAAEELAADLQPHDSEKMARMLAERVRGFFRSALKTIRTGAMAATLALVGPGELTDEGKAALALEVAGQEKYLRGFEADVLSGKQKADGTLASRAEMYGAAAYGVGQNASRQMAESLGAKYERRILSGADESCPTCVEEAGKGWRPAGTLRSLGDSFCHGNCRCSWEFSDELPAPEFAPSTASLDLGGHDADVMQRLRAIFGRAVPARRLADLIGAPPGVTVQAKPTHDGISISVRDPGIHMDRTLLSRDGAPVLRNNVFILDQDKSGKGLGAKILGLQVQTAAEEGVASIEAVGLKGEGWVGYYAWPRLGFDGPIEPADEGVVIPPLPRGLSGAQSIGDLMETAEGREWWKANGVSVTVSFDPSGGSRSRRVLVAYLAERADAVKSLARRPSDPGERPDPMPGDDAILDRIWDGIGDEESDRKGRRPIVVDGGTVQPAGD